MKTIQKLFPILFLVATQLCAIAGLGYLYLNTFNLI
jgi:hypothetical protein